ncbi:MAG: hypothetical protein H0U18_00395 [Pyrinomonadaceae bacterium]|nr:hypothetical protein [Pyrinomonadaceae bacterium]
MDSDLKPKSDHGSSPDPEASSASIEQALRKQFSEAKNATERQLILELTRELARLSLDQAAATLETSATIAGVSLRSSVEFLRAAPEVAETLAAAELRLWGEMGRRLALGDVETAISFFLAGVRDLKGLPRDARAIVFQLCSRQMTLSVPIAAATLRKVGALSEAVPDSETLVATLETAAEISRRSAKHSSDFLAATPLVIQCLDQFDDRAVKQRALALASAFAFRAGGIATDAWAAMPTALANLKSEAALQLLDRTGDFLERGGGGALHLMLAGGEVLRILPELFNDWIELLWVVARHGNASLVAFVRSTPRFVRGFLTGMDRNRAVELSKRVVSLTAEIARLDGEAALACFRASPGVLRTVAIEQFEEWVKRGLLFSPNDTRARRSYFALETRGSYEVLHSDSSGLTLDSIQHLLCLYVEALTGREVELAPIAAVPVETRIGDGRTIHLPALVAEFGDDDLDFRLYKALAAHAAGQIEFGTQECDAVGLSAAYSAIAETYDPANVNARDAFALDGYINDPQRSEAAMSPAEEVPIGPEDRYQLPPNSDYRAVLALFPHPQLARRIFGTLENGRIDARLRRQYRGLARDLDLIREHLRRSRPAILDVPATLVPFELLFQITLLGGALDDSRQYYGQIVSELETVAAGYLADSAATVADTLMATSRVYSLFQSVAPADDSFQQLETTEDSSDNEDQSPALSETLKSRPRDRKPQRRDARELFNAWNDPSAEGDPDDLEGGEAWIEAESPEQNLEEGEVAYNYDERDRELTDHRLAGAG